MLKIFTKTIKERYVFLIILIAICIVTLWMYVALYPTFSSQSADYEKLLAQFPKEMWEVFGVHDGKLSMTTLEQFVSMEMFSLLWPIIAIIQFISFGIGMIAGEIETGTMEILLSQPVSRLKIFFAKYFGGAVLIVLFCFFSVMCVIPLAEIYNVAYVSDVYWKIFLVGSLFTLTGFSLTIMFSSIFSKGKATLISAGIFLVMYIINILATLKETLKGLQYFSLFHYLDLSKILSSNELDIVSIVVFSVIIIVSTATAAWYFAKRDIAV